MKTPHCPFATLLGAYLLLNPTVILGQSLRGQVVDDELGHPVEGVLVVLLDGSENELAATLTNSSGWFRFPDQPESTVAIQAERIGYETKRVEPPASLPSQQFQLRIRLRKKAIPLDPLMIEGTRECVVHPDEGLVLADLWEEARKALTNQEWVAGETSRAFEILRYRRRLDRSGRTVESESEEERRVVGATAIRSLPAADLMEKGFVRPVDGQRDSYLYYGPDARSLLSEEFLDSHCLRLAGAGGPSGTVGIAFEPVGTSGIRDIQGTLFLDATDFELEAIEFEYTWAPAPEVKGLARGRVELEALPDGAWVIREWWIRLPELARTADPDRGLGVTVTGFLVEGEELMRAPSRAAPSRLPNRGSVRGLVWDSLSGGPLSSARVFLSGTEYVTESDSSGAFVLSGVRAGTYGMILAHPLLDSLSYVAPRVTVRVGAGTETEVTMAVPSARTLWLARCGGVEEEGAASAVSGSVFDFFTLKPIPGASVVLEWTDHRPREARRSGGETRTAETVTDHRGRFHACGIPAGVLVTARAAWGQESGTPVAVATYGETVSPVKLFLGGSAASGAAEGGRRCPAGSIHAGLGSVVGRVVEAATGVPVGKVQVWLTPEDAGERQLTEADATGQFHFCSLDPGPHSLRAAVRGVGDARASVTVGPDRTTRQDLQLVLQGAGRVTGSVQGRVVGAEDGVPLSGVVVTLDPDEAARVTGDDGSFSFTDVPMGTIRLGASLLGRGDAEGTLILGGGQTLEIVITLSLEPLELDPISVEVSRLEPLDLLAEVRERARRGWGTVLLDEEMQVRRSAMKTTSILQEYGATVLPQDSGLFFRRTGCGPVVYIDGIKVTIQPRSGMGAGVAESADAVNRVSPFLIRAMEIYRGPAQVPGEFLDSNARCGVILIWTRRGGDPGKP